MLWGKIKGKKMVGTTNVCFAVGGGGEGIKEREKSGREIGCEGKRERVRLRRSCSL